jgi:hypothetical protein
LRDELSARPLERFVDPRGLGEARRLPAGHAEPWPSRQLREPQPVSSQAQAVIPWLPPPVFSRVIITKTLPSGATIDLRRVEAWHSLYVPVVYERVTLDPSGKELKIQSMVIEADGQKVYVVTVCHSSAEA